jgi:integrase
VNESLNRIERFFRTYDSPNTIHNYRAYLKNYFKTFYKGEKKDFNLEVECEKYFEKKRDYKDDVEKFYETIKHRPPKSVIVLTSVVKTFLEYNDIELLSSFWKRLCGRKRGNRALTQDRIPTREELQEIFSVMNPRGRAFYMVLASSGMRGGEALQLREDDITHYTNYAKIELRGEYTKSGNGRTVFISRARACFMDLHNVGKVHFYIFCVTLQEETIALQLNSKT